MRETTSNTSLVGNFTDMDVLLGRGERNNAGNVKFRKLVQIYAGEYSTASRKQKEPIARKIFEQVKDLRGRFLDDKTYKELPEKRVIEKIKTSLRDYVRYHLKNDNGEPANNNRLRGWFTNAGSQSQVPQVPQQPLPTQQQQQQQPQVPTHHAPVPTAPTTLMPPANQSTVIHPGQQHTVIPPPRDPQQPETTLSIESLVNAMDSPSTLGPSLFDASVDAEEAASRSAAAARLSKIRQEEMGSFSVDMSLGSFANSVDRMSIEPHSLAANSLAQNSSLAPNSMAPNSLAQQQPQGRSTVDRDQGSQMDDMSSVIHCLLEMSTTEVDPEGGRR